MSHQPYIYFSNYRSSWLYFTESLSILFIVLWILNVFEVNCDKFSFLFLSFPKQTCQFCVESIFSFNFSLNISIHYYFKWPFLRFLANENVKVGHVLLATIFTWGWPAKVMWKILTSLYKLDNYTWQLHLKLHSLLYWNREWGQDTYILREGLQQQKNGKLSTFCG